MDEYKLKGIVISAIDYKENDKLITIYSLELGKITATLKGVKSKNAKLKFASQIFCFAEFVLVKKSDYFTVVSVDQIESFYDLTADYEKFLIGQSILEIVGRSTIQNSINEQLFLFIIKALSKLIEEELTNNSTVLIKFMIDVFQINGYALNFDACGECGSKIVGDIFLNLNLGNLTCSNCKGYFYEKINNDVLSLLRIINNSNYNNLHTIKASKEKTMDIIDLLTKNFSQRFSYSLKTIKSIMV